jgi:beta-phosphoglucomutase
MQVRPAPAAVDVDPNRLPLIKPTIQKGLALIFDMDGVIVNSMPLHEESWSAYLLSLGIDPTDLLGRMHGRRNDEIVRNYLGADADEQDVFAHGAAKEQLYRDMMAPQLERWMVPGIREFLISLGAVPVGLASNAERANVDFLLEGANLGGFFQVVADGSQVEHAKPAPDIYQLVARKLGTHPKNCIVFEDSAVGVAAARAAGARVVGVQTQAKPLEDVDLRVADFNSLELPGWLGSQRAL